MMEFSVESFLVLGLVGIFWYILYHKKNPLNDIPGPRAYPLVGNVLQLDIDKVFIQFAKLGQQYGGIFKVYFFNKPVVVVTDEELIHEVLVKKSANFAGRPHSFRLQFNNENLAAVSQYDAGEVHSGRRKVLQKYLKQFGSGLQKIEEVTLSATNDLVHRLTEQDGAPISVRDFLYKCVSDVIMIMLIGDTVSMDEVRTVKEAFDVHVKSFSGGSGLVLDMFPAVRFFGNSAYGMLQEVFKSKETITGRWMRLKPTNGYVSFLQTMSETEQRHCSLESEKDQRSSVWELHGAGIFTTSSTLSVLMNTLCHYPQVQEKLRAEIMKVIGSARQPTLKDQQNMPYLRATMLEIGRFASIVPLALPHKAVKTCSLGKFTIPKDTEIWLNLWAMHHDEKLWHEPFSFQPERFLDVDGLLVPASHQNRRHLMPFGAGHRVCVGEVFAMSRMFLIISRILQNFSILPESTLDKQPSCDPRDTKMGIALVPIPYKVRFQPL